MGDVRKPVIFGCGGGGLTASERTFFEASQPAGFILFSRNIHSPDQVKKLVSELKSTSNVAHPAILIDQEGGRVQRLGPPAWPQYPAMETFGKLYRESPLEGLAALRLNLARIVSDLRPVGINIDCLPLLDVPAVGADGIIGDRAFSNQPATVAALGKTSLEVLLEFGCLPVIKHIPGHGRAGFDSHKRLPIVDASLEELAACDFLPFVACASAPLAMTAHVAYRAIDGERPASLSKTIVSEIIRGHIGFKGLLISDDIGMGALSGDFSDRTEAVLQSGTDLVLHCSGNLEEMRAVAEAAGAMDPSAMTRLDDWLETAHSKPMPDLE